MRQFMESSFRVHAGFIIIMVAYDRQDVVR